MLPPDAVYLMIRGRPYYRYQSIYYMPLGNNSYQVIPEPNEEKSNTTTGVTAGSGYEKFVLEGRVYYKKGNKYYKAKRSDDGELRYEEIGETSK